LKNIREGHWYVEANLQNFEELKLTNLHRLLPADILNRIEKYLQKKGQFDKLKEENDKEINKIFSKYFNDDIGYGGGASLHIQVYINLFQRKFIFENFSRDYFKFTKEEFEKLKKQVNENKEIQDFINFRSEVEKEGDKLVEDMISAYKNDVLMPEARKTFLTLTMVTIVLVVATGSGIWINKLQYDKFSELVDRQLKSIPPLKPDIQFFVKGDGKFSDFDLATPIKLKEDGTIDKDGWRKSRLTLGFVNLGQNPAGIVNVHLDNKKLQFPSENLGFLGGTSTGDNSILTPFSFWYNKCGETESEEDCTTKDVPKGVIVINISITCQLCDKEIHKSFNICIYNRTEKCSNFQIN